jgi:hypothetical protein
MAAPGLRGNTPEERTEMSKVTYGSFIPRPTLMMSVVVMILLMYFSLTLGQLIACDGKKFGVKFPFHSFGACRVIWIKRYKNRAGPAGRGDKLNK